MKIANIVIEEKNEKFLKKVDFVEYFNSYKGIPKRPTLIIGWEFTKSLFPSFSSLSILQKTITPLTSWTFSRTEKRNEFEKDITNFYIKIFENLKSQFEYRFINIFQTSYKEISNIIKIIKSPEKTNIYVFGNSFIYIYCNNVVYGINIDDIEYIGIQKNKILNIFYKTPNKIIFYNTDFIPKDILLLLRDNKMLIPLLNNIINS